MSNYQQQLYQLLQQQQQLQNVIGLQNFTDVNNFTNNQNIQQRIKYEDSNFNNSNNFQQIPQHNTSNFQSILPTTNLPIKNNVVFNSNNNNNNSVSYSSFIQQNPQQSQQQQSIFQNFVQQQQQPQNFYYQSQLQIANSPYNSSNSSSSSPTLINQNSPPSSNQQPLLPYNLNSSIFSINNDLSKNISINNSNGQKHKLEEIIDDEDEENSEDFENQTSTIGGDSKKKNKRISGTTIVSKACEFCRQHHKKCDGRNPCTTCVEKKLQCVYTSRKRRGPKKGVQEEIKKQLSNLKEQLEKEKQQANEWRFKYLESIKYLESSKATNQNLISIASPPLKVSSSSPPLDPKRKRDSSPDNSSNDSDESSPNLVVSTKKSRQPLAFEDLVSFERRIQRMISEIPLSPTLDFHLYLSSLVSEFLDVYYIYVHPFHPLLPEDYPKDIGSLCKILVNTNSNSKIPGINSNSIIISKNTVDNNENYSNEEDENNSNSFSQQGKLFVLLAILANSCLKIGDKKHADEFINRARALAGIVFDRVDYCIGCGFGLITYYYICIGEFDKVSSYASIIDNICIRLNATNTHLYAINFYFKIFFAYGQFENMCDILDKLLDSNLRDKQSILTDRITSTCFRSHVEMYSMVKKGFSQDSYPMLNKLYGEINQMEQLYSSNVFEKHIGRLLILQIYCSFSHIAFRLHQYDVAAKWAFKVLDFVKNDSNYKYVCIMVLNTVIPVSMDILFELKYYEEYYYLLNETKQLAETFTLFKPEYQRLSERVIILDKQKDLNQLGYSPPQARRTPPQEQFPIPQQIQNQNQQKIENNNNNNNNSATKILQDFSNLDPETSVTLLQLITSQVEARKAAPLNTSNINDSNSNNNSKNNIVSPVTPSQEFLSTFDSTNSPTSSHWDF